ncbi:MAG: hypothetical protein K2X77_21505 [Candidatus Obscuribacterales bacterium]|nr:hypothetical protein [Candidatus Obscuribacterales bacterium]
MPNFLSKFHKHIKHQEIALFMFIVAVCLFKFPLQKHITLARFQHYGICLYVWSLGFLIQTVWSWKYLTARGRLAMLSTGFYVGIFAMVFYSSPWLDVKMAVQTEDQGLLRILYSILCALLGIVVAIFWLIWVIEDKSEDELEKSEDTKQ